MPNRFELTLILEDSLVQQQDLYARLELITPELEAQRAINADSLKPKITDRLGQWGNTLLKYFTGSREPRISSHRGADGNVYYEVYDPIDRQRHTFSSEHEVRVWLEGRYYQ